MALQTMFDLRYIYFSLVLLSAGCRTFNSSFDAKDPKSVLDTAQAALLRGDDKELRSLLTPKLWSFYFEDVDGQRERRFFTDLLVAVRAERARVWFLQSRKGFDPVESTLVHSEVFHVFNLENRDQDATYKVSLRVVPLSTGSLSIRAQHEDRSFSPEEKRLRATLKGWQIARIEKISLSPRQLNALFLTRVAPFVRSTYQSLVNGQVASQASRLAPDLLRALRQPGALAKMKHEFGVQFAPVAEREKNPEGSDGYVISRSLLRFPRLLMAPGYSRRLVLQAEMIFLEEGAEGFDPINPYGFQVEAFARGFNGAPRNLAEAIFLLRDDDLVLTSFSEEPYRSDYLEGIDHR